jgi:hypothetical protein
LPHGIAGAGAVFGAIVQEGALTVIAPSHDRAAIFRKPTAAVSTNITTTTNMSHLLIGPLPGDLQPGGVYKQGASVKGKIS